MTPTIPEALHQALAPHPEGLGLEALLASAGGMARRTLQRHLATWVKEGKIQAVGRGPTRKYRLVEATEARPTEGISSEPQLWLSKAGAAVQALVRRPLQERSPVGYQRGFLDRYLPNQDSYLPRTLRHHLHQLGRSPEGERPAGTYARQILDRLLIDLSWASSRLEGNTYTRLDTQNLIEFGQKAEGKDQRETQMILNHKAAVEMLVEDAESISFNRYTLQNLHAILADNLLENSGASGRLRSIPVSISGTTYQPTGIPQVIAEAFDQLLAKTEAIQDPFEQVFFVMVQLPYLQPFEDVNKRLSRVAANIPLIRQNLAPLSFVDVPERPYVEAILGVYELNRVEMLRDLFAWAYERSCQRYTILRDALPSPDPLRMQYRTALAELVRETVREGRAIEAEELQKRAKGIVETADLDAVVAMAINELYKLHEGNIVRFGLRLGEFRTWAEQRGR